MTAWLGVAPEHRPLACIEDGFSLLPGCLHPDSLSSLAAAVAPSLAAAAGRGGVRNLLETCDAVRAVAAGSMGEAAASVLGDDCGAVRAILFDKTREANWKVIWHQDLTIAVAGEVRSLAWGPWSLKDGALHVRPPVEILEKMVAVRLHLDRCGEDDGPLRVIPGSHLHGCLSAEDADALRARSAEHVCVVDRGGLLVMRPLLLHASSPAREPGHRRVLHVEYGPRDLPDDVCWRTWIRANSP